MFFSRVASKRAITGFVNPPRCIAGNASIYQSANLDACRATLWAQRTIMEPVSVGVKRVLYRIAVKADFVFFGNFDSLVPGGSLYLK